MGGGGYDPRAERIEKAIEYVPLEELDKAIEKGKVPAKTVVPLRMITIHAEVPYKRQLEEMQAGVRLPDGRGGRQVAPEVRRLRGPAAGLPDRPRRQAGGGDGLGRVQVRGQVRRTDQLPEVRRHHRGRGTSPTSSATNGAGPAACPS